MAGEARRPWRTRGECRVFHPLVPSCFVLPALAVVVIFALCSLSDAQSDEGKRKPVAFELGPVPAWVKPVTWPKQLPPGTESTGTVYLLVDQQENLMQSASYYHQVRKIVSEEGVQNADSITASFNPAFQKLIFNSIQVIRSGAKSNRLDRSRIQLLQRENDPERLVYNPSYTAQVALDDLRVGDVIEFAYTTEGVNPLSQHRYSMIFAMQWGVPVGRNFLRLLYPANRNIRFNERNDTTPTSGRSAGGKTEWIYDAVNIPARKVADDVPADYYPLRAMEITEFDDWDDVARWATPSWETPVPHSVEFQSEVARLVAIPDPEQRVVEALRFVQDDIRYITVQSGPGTRAPTVPDEVLRRRFGDYKDKVVLLVMLLRQAGVDAVPALVSDSYLSAISKRLPSPRLFDHALVRVRLGKATYWVDPTRTAQHGPLSQIFSGDYGYALVLAPGTKELTAFSSPPESQPVRIVTETYRVPAPNDAAELDVVTEYHGLAADNTRSTFHESTRGDIQKHYLQYYARTFPDIQVRKPLWYEELPAQNDCKVTEAYTIPHIWQLNKEKDRYELFLRPGDIYSAVGSEISPKRSDPLKLDYPSRIVEEMDVEMFEEWPFDSTGETVSTDFFRLVDKPTADGSHLQFNYSYEVLKDRVAVNEIPKFNAAVDKVNDMLGYTLKYRTPEQIKRNRKPVTFNWAVAAAAICFFGMAVSMAFRYFRRSRLPAPIPPPVDSPARLNGIGGWLIFLAIVQILKPFLFVRPLFTLLPTMMKTDSWRSLTDPIESAYNPWWAPVLLYELFFNLACLAFCVMLVALFFTKRLAWPRSFIVFVILSLAGVILDICLAHQIPAARESLDAILWDVLPGAIFAAIWIPYAVRSKRVRATFRY
jgi:transglutaminase-like putative cysteine protease